MKKTIDNSRAALLTSSPFLPGMLALCMASALQGQTVLNNISTGLDGNLVVAPGVTTKLAAPVGGGSIYNFKTIQIPFGSTLKLSGAVYPNPLYFLAQGAVTIGGTIDLSGQGGSVPTTTAQRTGPTVSGSGGYGGGPAAFGGEAPLLGLGPKGGAVSVQYGCGAVVGGSGGFSGNQFLVPLVGGSGGGGWTGSGGAGGGALLIASSVSITVTGTITAAGGSGAGNSGGGAGGGIRLVAPSIAGTGTLTAAGGGYGFSDCNGNNNGGASGIVRLEYFQNAFTGTTGGSFYTANPFNLSVPSATAQPSISVTSINGVSVKTSPTGSFTVPDVTVSQATPMTVNIQASNIPLGTIPTVYFSTENFPDQKIAANAPGLAGTLASSTATATVTLNPGYTIGYVVAKWTQ